MKITALVENRAGGGLEARHGLSLYIETAKHRLLFDVGPDDAVFKNSERLGIDLTKVDAVILSHGHMDHGGALEQFLKINSNAKVYAQRKAFEHHYAKILFKKIHVGVDPALQTHPQMVLLDGDCVIDDELTLFTVRNTSKYRSNANDTLYSVSGKDDFAHEQCLIISGDTNTLVMGCGHTGIVNILERVEEYMPRVCVGGYHLMNPNTKRTVPNTLLDGIAEEMKKRDIRYYTCHCTGQKAYGYLAARLPDMHYLACGDTIEI